YRAGVRRPLDSFPTRRSSDLGFLGVGAGRKETVVAPLALELLDDRKAARGPHCGREHQQRDEQRRQRGGEPGDPREIPGCAFRGTCRAILPYVTSWISCLISQLIPPLIPPLIPLLMCHR